MSITPFLAWCQSTGVGTAIGQSSWLFAAIEAIHLVGLAVMGGAVLLVDMRLLGLGLWGQPARDLARDAQPWLLGSLMVMFATGTLLFLSEATKFDGLTNSAGLPFTIKMVCLFLGIVFTFTVRRKMLTADEARMSPLRSRLVGLVSITLWSGVGIGGRAIGFY